MATSDSDSIVALDFEASVVEIQKRINDLKTMMGENGDPEMLTQIRKMEEHMRVKLREVYSNLSNWEITQVARHPQRPLFLDYAESIFEDFEELHGDRQFSDDGSTVCGIAKLDGTHVMLIGQQKGRTMEDSIKRNFGYPNPEGYRKALRFMKMAEKFRRPIITFIDTPGAYPGMGAEERGQGEAIARNLYEMATLTVPVISCVVGEGGSGGALGIGVANRILMLRYAIYSVISPESCASILWRTNEEKIRAAEALKNSAEYAKQFGIVDEIVDEPLGGAHRDAETTSKNLKAAITRHLKELLPLSPDEVREARHKKFEALGVIEIEE